MLFILKFNWLVILLLLSLASQILAVGTNQTHSVTWGTRLSVDYIIHGAIITEEAKPNRVVEYEYEVNLRPLWRRITQIVITDQTKNGEGGFASLISGGPTRDMAKLRFTSQRGKGFSFTVEVYGI